MPKIKEVVGHERQIAELQQQVEKDNISHAYIFAGPKHVGKMTTAFWFANQILQKDVPADHQVKVQQQIEKLTHPDLLVLDRLWIEKECDDWDVLAKYSNIPQVHRSKKSSPARTDTISIDDVRAMQERLHEKSLGKRSCCLIRSVERMQDAAANALLKILEEPPVGLTFLLTTQASAALLPTIKSRARIIRFTRLPQESMQSFVEKLDDTDAAFVLRMAQGAPGVARRLAADPDALRETKQLHNAVRRFWETDSLQQRLQILAPLKQRGAEADELLLHLALAARALPTTNKAKNLQALLELMQGLHTNVNPQLLGQAFALAVAK